jgi:phage terminase large subunit-like protein
MEHGKDRGIKWDKKAAKRAIDFFIEVLRLAGGEHEGKPFKLEPSQVFIVGSLFGWKTQDDSRRFRVAYIEEGKGNGKSPLAAGVGLYMQVADKEPRAEIYAAATKKDQAMILFRDAVAMVDQSKSLSAKFTKSGTGLSVWNLAYLSTSSFFRPISADDGQSGPRPHCALIDEIHEHKTSQVVEMMRAGTKGRRQALIFMITNSGYDRTSLCWEYHQYGVKVSNGDLEDDSFFAYICALDEGEDPLKDEKCWKKANPLLGVSIHARYLREQVREARGMPSKESIVRRLNFCQWVDAANPWIDGDLWRACIKDFELDEVRHLPCYLGLDLSERQDLTALAAVWRDMAKLYGRVWYWTPGDTIEERSRRDNVNYVAWARQGFIHAPPGRSIDYAYPAQFVAEQLMGRFNIMGLAFDRWHITYFMKALEEAFVTCHIYDGKTGDYIGSELCLRGHGQGWVGGGSDTVLWMPRSIDLLEDAVLKTNLQIQSNPILNWNSASAVLEADPVGNRKWEKRKSTGRIDGMVALSQAVGLAFANDVAIQTIPDDYELLVV